MKTRSNARSSKTDTPWKRPGRPTRENLQPLALPEAKQTVSPEKPRAGVLRASASHALRSAPRAVDLYPAKLKPRAAPSGNHGADRRGVRQRRCNGKSTLRGLAGDAAH